MSPDYRRTFSKAIVKEKFYKEFLYSYHLYFCVTTDYVLL